jgi:ribosomal protein S4
MPPGQQQRKKILAHYYLKYARYTLFYKVKKRRDILSNFFSYDRKILKLYAHRVEKFVYKRYPYKTQKYNTKFFFPNYSNYRFLFKNQIKAQHTFRWLYRLSYKQLVKIYKKTIFYSKRRFEFVFLKYLELRLDTVLYRLNMAFSLKQARQWVKKGLFLVNNKPMIWPKYQVNVGDVVSPVLLIRSHHWPQQNWTMDFGQIYNSTRLFWRPIQIDQYPDHFMINERIPAGVVTSNPNIYKVYHTRPLSIQFLTMSLLKYS